MNTKYTTEEIALEAALSRAANEEGAIQAADMMQFTNEPTLHITMSVSRTFSALTGKSYDTDRFCD